MVVTMVYSVGFFLCSDYIPLTLFTYNQVHISTPKIDMDNPYFSLLLPMWSFIATVLHGMDVLLPTLPHFPAINIYDAVDTRLPPIFCRMGMLHGQVLLLFSCIIWCLNFLTGLLKPQALFIMILMQYYPANVSSIVAIKGYKTLHMGIVYECAAEYLHRYDIVKCPSMEPLKLRGLYNCTPGIRVHSLAVLTPLWISTFSATHISFCFHFAKYVFPSWLDRGSME